MCWVRSLDLQVDHDSKQLAQLLRLWIVLHCGLQILDVHGLGENVFANVQLCERVRQTMTRHQKFGFLTEVLFQDFFFALLQGDV